MNARLRIAAAVMVMALPAYAGAVDAPPPDPVDGGHRSAAPTPKTANKATPPTRKKAKKPRYVFTFGGRGFGHGVGMSQYGAYGAALAGESAEQIIARYYRGTTLQTLPVTPVRVLLGSGARTVKLTASGAWTLKVEGSPLVNPQLPVGSAVTFSNGAGDLVTVTDGTGAVLTSAAGPIVLSASPGSPALITFRGTRYRGAIRLIPSNGAMSVVNHVDLEQYLAGVVPREMPAAWGGRAPEALEAQAIAARSYAMATRKSGALFDMYADERSQVYGGVNAEDPRSTQAVLATAGKVVTYGGKIATTFFFSTSGGRTESVENVFNPKPIPYLVGVPDPFDRVSPHHVWKDPKTFTDRQLATRLGIKGLVARVQILQRGDSPRVMRIRVFNRNGQYRDLRGPEVRRRLGLRDTWFTVRRRVMTPRSLTLVTQSLAADTLSPS